ncbi:MAG: hypothetical protein K0Q95_412 [Bacteroidota bacterium]|jgi:hypothetical protein|nr:hypothetical protein [Bacteroidota bacterium]
MKVNLKHFCYLFLIFQTCNLWGQHTKADSLSALLEKDVLCSVPCIGDTTKANHLQLLSWELSFRDSDTALKLTTEAQRIVENICRKTLILILIKS